MMDQLGSSWWGRINGSLLAGKIDAARTMDGIENTSNIMDEPEDSDVSFVPTTPNNEVFETSAAMANVYPQFSDNTARGDDDLIWDGAEPDQLKTPRVAGALMPALSAPLIVVKSPSSLVRPPAVEELPVPLTSFCQEDSPESPHWGDVSAPADEAEADVVAQPDADGSLAPEHHQQSWEQHLREQEQEELHAQQMQEHERPENPEMQDCAQYDVGGPAGDHGGPAVFQGFRPPPSYAWGRLIPVEPVEPPEISAPVPHIPVRKSIGTNSAEIVGSSCGSTGKAEPPSAMAALAQAMDELRRCQNSCAQLRVEKRGVPVADVEHWCASIGDQLRVVCESLEQKLEAHRLKSLTKDETIRRLHRRLQAAEQGAAERLFLSSPSAAPQSPRSAAATGLSCGDEPSASPSPPPLSALRSGGGTPQSPKSPAAKAAGEAEGRIDGTPPPLPASWPAVSMMDSSPNGALSPAALESMMAADILEHGGISASPSQALPTMHSHSHTPAVQQEGRTMAGARCKRPGMDPAASQKCLPGRPGDKSQQVHLRREVAHLRRRDVDLAGQLRAKETQIEQLTSMMREMQAMWQKQLGLYKRQLHIKDKSLQELQEELTAGGAQHAVASPGPADGTPASGTRDARRHRVQPPLSGSASQAAGLQAAQTMPPGSSYHAGISAATAAAAAASTQEHQRSSVGASYGERGRCRGGVTPRPSDCDRRPVMNAATSTWPPPGKKEARERSLGAMPHSPRPKAREVHPQAAHAPPPALEGAARRRTSPSSGALARSTSADERRPRKCNDGPIAQRSLRGGAVAGAARGLGRR